MKYLSFITIICISLAFGSCEKGKKALNVLLEDNETTEEVQAVEPDEEIIEEEISYDRPSMDRSSASQSKKNINAVYIGRFRIDEYPAELSQERLTYSDIADLNRNELRLLRNAIYAAHNRRFQSADLHDYFSQFNWYTPLYNDYEISLNSIESANVKFIQRYE